MSDSRLPDLTPMSIPELYQGLDMGVGALAVHESLLATIVDAGLDIDSVMEIISGEIIRIESDLNAIALEIKFKAESS